MNGLLVELSHWVFAFRVLGAYKYCNFVELFFDLRLLRLFFLVLSSPDPVVVLPNLSTLVLPFELIVERLFSLFIGKVIDRKLVVVILNFLFELLGHIFAGILQLLSLQGIFILLLNLLFGLLLEVELLDHVEV